MHHHPRPFSQTTITYSDAEPKAKRRYEERMSTKLGEMQLKDSTEEKNREMTEKNQQSGPHIEEIIDW